MILEVREAQESAVFRQELFSTLSHYYEEILSMAGAGRADVTSPRASNEECIVALLLLRRPLVG
jgi:hypothetical protein